MPILKSLLFSIAQGLTEFLPVSSSGHLVFLGSLIETTFHSLSYDLFLHLATFFAVLVYFRKDIIALFHKKRKWILYIIIGSVPAGIAGVFFKSALESVFHEGSFMLLSIAFLITSLLVFKSGTEIERRKEEDEGDDLTIGKSLVIGLFQAFAIIPGISRSGSTIAAAVFMKVPPKDAFVFSFLLSIPAVGGAFLLDAWENREAFLEGSPLLLSVSFVAAFATGLLALYLLKKTIVNRHFKCFSYYTFVLFVAALLLAFFK